MKIFINAIMKNEIANIEQFYNNCKEADGIYVLDTGSTDGSVEKLKSMGSNVFVEQKIYDNFTFEVARNDALKMLPQEDAWVVHLDLDEFLVGDWKAEMLSVDAKATNIYYLYAFNYEQPNNVFLANKIVRNGIYHWKNPVHETVFPNKGEFVNYTTNKFQIHQKQDKNKVRNYKERLESCLKTHPQYELAKFYLLKEYFILGEYGKAIDLSKLVLESKLEDIYKMVTWLILYRCYIQMDSHVSKLENCLQRAQLACPYRREAYVEMMRFYTNLKMPHMVFWAGTNALAITSRPFDFIEMAEAWTDEPYNLYIRACQELGYNDVARRTYAAINGIMLLRGGMGGVSYLGLHELLQTLPHPVSMLEIGAYAGESTEFFANSNKVKSIISVDPWLDGEQCEHITFEKMAIVESLFDDRVRNHKKVTKIKAKIEDIPIPEVDMVYIDAIHTYEAVKMNIEMVKDKVKFIAGHDYTDDFPGVKMAVNEFAKQINKKVMVFSDTSWLIIRE